MEDVRRVGADWVNMSPVSELKGNSLWRPLQMYRCTGYSLLTRTQISALWKAHVMGLWLAVRAMRRPREPLTYPDKFPDEKK